MSFAKPSDAQKRKDSKVFAEELRKSGKNMKEVANSMSAEGYNSAEICSALHLKPSKLKEITTGEPQPSKKAAGQALLTVRKDAPEMSDRVSVLETLLEGTAGIAPNRIMSVLAFYKDREEMILSNPTILFNALTLAGLSWLKAKDIVSQWLFETNPDQLLPIYSQTNPRNTLPWALPPREDGGREEEFDIDKQLDRLSKMAQMKLLIQMTQMGAGGMSQMPGNVATEFVPLLDDKGNQRLDDNNNPMWITRYSPVQVQSNTDMLKVIELMSKNVGGSGEGFYTKFFDLLQAMTKQQTEDLKERLQRVESVDPVSYIKTTLEAMKELGLGQSTNVEIAKMQTDLEKWKFEQQAKREETALARSQLSEIGSSIRYGIEKIASPVAEEFAKGLNEKRSVNRDQAPAGTRTHADDVKNMTNEQLLQLSEEADKALAVVEKAQESVADELAARGLRQKTETPQT